ncbi:MAG TPA: ABC transporter permease [Acetobacteraceae bacterium]|jgi:simple sugar transport system permease protein|nr:ABC transporter permease [Acetobacteraceae bacterium]
MISPALLVGFAAASVRVGTPLGLAAVGEAIAEKSGVINLGIEGAMLGGAFAAAAGAAWGGTATGVLAAAAAGLLVAAAFAAIAVAARADQIIAGTAITLGATGLTGLLAQRVFTGPALTLPTLSSAPLPLLARIPVLGAVFFRQSVLTYVCYLLIPLASWLLWRTRFGLQLRASGESPAAATASGVAVGRMRSVAVLLGGICAGLAGAALVLAQVGTFTERMTAGRGFIAIAIVALGRWTPWGVGAAALLFGAATALQYTFQAAGSRVPYQLFIALPYLLALAALGVAIGRHRGPAALGQPH